MKVMVEIITGTFIDMEVSENATVKELTEKIAEEIKLPVKRLILVVGDEEKRRVVMETEEDMMLRDLGVGEYSHMYLFFKHPDLVSSKGRSQGDDDPMEEISSKAAEEEGEEEAKIDEEEEDEAMKDEEEDEKEKSGEEEKDKDDVKEEDYSKH